MGQSFQLVAPRARLALSWSGKLGEILFDGSARALVNLLVVPVRRRHSSPQNSLVDQTNTICEEKRGAKRTRDEQDAESPRRHKRVEVLANPISKTVVAFRTLPPEIHRLVFSFIEDIHDVISFGVTSRYFLPIALECLDDYYALHLGRWAGMNVVCVGRDVKPDDYPPGLFSDEELEEYPEDGTAWTEPFTLEHFIYPSVSTIEERQFKLSDVGLLLRGSCVDRPVSEDPAYHHMRPHFRVKSETYLPTDEQWILRNLTAKQIVRADAIALSPDYIRGPDIRVLGFGEVVLLRVCWSTSSCVSMRDTTGSISRGPWAGHRFDITTLSRHEAGTRREGWTDVSEEVAGEIAGIWEGEYGADWRDVICKGRSYV
ncbi:hypothetical protein F4802DRAFT_615313 [Xylaria palmicola]|nr:hypothetical protein F4802DRAFT_615313 [Xylaria palmicola]